MSVFHSQGRDWQPIERWAYSSEEELESFLLANPGLIGGERGDVWAVWQRQVASRSGNSLDLVGLGSDGSITIVECKLGANREERREVVAQVLEYASGLWEMPLERFRDLFRVKHPERRDPFDVLVERAPLEAAEGGWDVTQTQRIAAENLRLGRFRLVVAVDEISDRLTRIVDFVNARGGGDLKLVAVALPRYGTPDGGVVIPTFYGDRAPSPTDRSAAAVNPSIEEVLAMAAPEVASLARALHDYLSHPAAGRLAARANRTSVSYDARVSGTLRSTLQLYPDPGPKPMGPAVGLFLDRGAMTALGTTREAVLQEASRLGFQAHGFSVRLGPDDAARLADIKAFLDAEVLSRIDA